MSILDDFLGPDGSALPRRSTLTGITDEILQRQRGAESGNRHRNPDGSLIRNPTSGALGISQIMPATGVDPGFGIAPLRDQSEGEYKRFQQDYMNAMLGRYGDPGKALAAYNWGPGNFDKVADRPDWISHVPDETRKYVVGITGGVSSDVAAAVQSTVKPSKPAGSLLDSPAPDFGSADEYAGVSQQQSRTRAMELRARAQSRRPAPPGGPAAVDTSMLDEFLATPAGVAAAPKGDVTWGDYGRALQSGTAQFGQMLAGAGEYLGNRLDQTDGTKGVTSLVAEDARRFFGAKSQEYLAMMSPEAQDRLGREMLTLDPSQTI
jgi:hypothetical protein